MLETLPFKCGNCTLQGEQLTSNSLGFFRCSEAGCMHCICILCALSCEGAPISPQLFKLPLDSVVIILDFQLHLLDHILDHAEF